VDDAVLRAIARWPNVPSVYGWLSLDRRGNWAIKGERIANRAITEFICRNYACDERGRWFFQNGPQRVYAGLAYTPIVYRTVLDRGSHGLIAHTGMAVEAITGVWIDEAGALLAQSAAGVGVIHDQDLSDVLQWLVDSNGAPLDDAALEAWTNEPNASTAWFRLSTQSLTVAPIESASVPLRFGFDPAPRPAPGEPEC